MTIRWALNITRRGQAIFTSGEGWVGAVLSGFGLGHGEEHGNSTADMRPGGGEAGRGAGRWKETGSGGHRKQAEAGLLAGRGVQGEGETTFPSLSDEDKITP